MTDHEAIAILSDPSEWEGTQEMTEALAYAIHAIKDRALLVDEAANALKRGSMWWTRLTKARLAALSHMNVERAK